jgi:hypothetical protein
MTKIEIEGKCCHEHSNYELTVSAVILIQIIKHVDAFFLRDTCKLNKQTDRLHIFPASLCFSCHCIGSKILFTRSITMNMDGSAGFGWAFSNNCSVSSCER